MYSFMSLYFKQIHFYFGIQLFPGICGVKSNKVLSLKDFIVQLGEWKNNTLSVDQVQTRCGAITGGSPSLGHAGWSEVTSWIRC
jgi:hypothetical protein